MGSYLHLWQKSGVNVKSKWAPTLFALTLITTLTFSWNLQSSSAQTSELTPTELSTCASEMGGSLKLASIHGCGKKFEVLWHRVSRSPATDKNTYLILCTSKNSAYSYALIRKSCSRTQNTAYYSHDAAIVGAPEISVKSALALSDGSVAISLECDHLTSDAPITYITIAERSPSKVFQNGNKCGKIHLTGLSPNTKYIFHISASNYLGTSPVVATQQITTAKFLSAEFVPTPPAPPAPTPFDFTFTPPTLTLSSAPIVQSVLPENISSNSADPFACAVQQSNYFQIFGNHLILTAPLNTETATSYILPIRCQNGRTLEIVSHSLTINVPQDFQNGGLNSMQVPTGTYVVGHQGPVVSVNRWTGVGAVTFTSATPLICTIDATSGLTTLVGAGMCAITASAVAAPTNQNLQITAALFIVQPALVVTTLVPTLSLTVGSAMSASTPVQASGGTLSFTYSISPALPSGLNFDASTGEITGTPTQTFATNSFTISVVDSTPGVAQNESSTFSLTVNSPLSSDSSINSIALTEGLSGPSTSWDSPSTSISYQLVTNALAVRIAVNFAATGEQVSIDGIDVLSSQSLFISVSTINTTVISIVATAEDGSQTTTNLSVTPITLVQA